MHEERFQDEPVVDGEVVRKFMYTEGRTRAYGASELPLETLVSLTPDGRSRIDELRFERRLIAQRLEATHSIAELAAHLGIPLRAAVVIASEMVAEGLLEADDVVDEVDLSLLHRIRQAIAAL